MENDREGMVLRRAHIVRPFAVPPCKSLEQANTVRLYGMVSPASYLLPFYEWLQRMINCGIITIKYGNLSG